METSTWNNLSLNTDDITIECEMCLSKISKTDANILSFNTKQNDGKENGFAQVNLCSTCFQFFMWGEVFKYFDITH